MEKQKKNTENSSLATLWRMAKHDFEYISRKFGTIDRFNARIWRAIQAGWSKIGLWFGKIDRLLIYIWQFIRQQSLQFGKRFSAIDQLINKWSKNKVNQLKLIFPSLSKIKPFVHIGALSFFLFAFIWWNLSSTQTTKMPPEAGSVNLADLEEKVKSDKKDSNFKIGQAVDYLDGIPIFYNGDMLHTDGRNKSSSGYNYGLKWQCVEFVKRYYYDHLKHQMPNTWGHAREFFNLNLTNGAYNVDRGLYQFRNGSKRKPKEKDILVFASDEFGHVAIISKVTDTYIEVAQQNVGAFSRMRLKLSKEENGRWRIRDAAVLGWLGKTR